ncbi:hypothetical protein AMATHDRAFT_4371 [Amanita thiersii Skay4041]|uniref:Uncharacterized protein n=1 Tax=Amanita thiersii Skay4041 TaxID=703135 RepID=A0A2A9NQT2_9AGAR|nr:hypothetical protein AMATHDRAFT_4371 [Amanita thiersii Skay4041]
MHSGPQFSIILTTASGSNRKDDCTPMSPETTAAFQQEITAQTEAFNQLRLLGTPQDQIDQAKKALGELKKQLSIAKGATDVGESNIKLNHHKILDRVFSRVVCHPKRSISSVVNKIGKSLLSQDDVGGCEEMTEEKGWNLQLPIKLGNINKRGRNLCPNNSKLTLFLLPLRMPNKISFDLSLARGLNHYTNITYEAVVKGSAPPPFQANANTVPVKGATLSAKEQKKINADAEEEVDKSTVEVGPIVTGGRYDNWMEYSQRRQLVTCHRGKEEATSQLPCDGVRICIDCIFGLVWCEWVEKGMRNKGTTCYIMAADDGLSKERMKLACELREAGIILWLIEHEQTPLTLV